MRSSKTFIIAEAGVNHNGQFRAALELVDAAKNAGADAVKFQLYKADKLQPERYELLKRLELSQEQMHTIAAYCKSAEIEFMCTPFDVESLDYLVSLKVKRLKIASGCIGNFDLLHAAYQSGLPVILSTGMSTIGDIRKALDHLAANVTLMHCTSAYPAPIDSVHLKAMDLLRETFFLPVGYSDHTQGITVSLAAVARGAFVIEKHLTMSRNQIGPDHRASLEPSEFRTLVNAIRTVEEALGDAVKLPQGCELELKRMWHQ